MKNIWMRLNEYGHHCPKVPYRRGMALTEKLIDALAEHATANGHDRGQAYQVLDVGSSPKAELALMLAELGQESDTPKSLKGIHVTALDIAPSGVDIGRSKQAGNRFRYIQQDACDLSQAGPHHAVIISALLEYVDKIGLLRQSNRVLPPGGLLALVVHAPDSDAPDRLERDSLNERKAAQALVDFHEGKIDQTRAEMEISMAHRLPPNFQPTESSHPHGGFIWGWALAELFRKVNSNPQWVQTSRAMLEKGVFEDRIEIAHAIQRNRFKTERDVKTTLKKTGFEMQDVFRYQVPSGPILAGYGIKKGQ